ncbi:hypothetical protein J1N35_015145 [Gossypium stocksii]|uniref:Aminotransferase-like plant mobile domain-containing protein n=1 Tax=Gossypium stocksii TaxID=47602 RepID=A0A9D4AA28_9ROSI|nr:hypothetical protein J1N35_015145 [Gossypium stocksii]
MTPLIKNDGHISNTVNNMVNGLGYFPDERLMPYLELAGFGSAVLIRTFDLRYDLISTLVKCWRLETHTFHFPCKECTITLEDVALQLGLLIDGSAVTSTSAIVEPAAICYSLLGVLPTDDESNFTVNATEHEVMCAARADIMHIIDGVLMPDANNNRVHLMYQKIYTVPIYRLLIEQHAEKGVSCSNIRDM